MYADMNYEYPLRDGIAVNPIVAGYGKLTPDDVPLAKIGDNKKLASELVDKVGFDN
jgi:iron(III) transport system substrate-binding protein